MKLTLRAARVNSGLKTKEVADRLGYTVQTILHWERGKTKIKEPIFEALANLYGMSKDDIFLPEVSKKGDNAKSA